jgi:hypothetical protein
MRRPSGRATGARRRIAAAVWGVMMLVWLVALGFGAWRIWPQVARLGLTGELVVWMVWLVTGFAAWLLALRFGLQRYWRR